MSRGKEGWAGMSLIGSEVPAPGAGSVREVGPSLIFDSPDEPGRSGKEGDVMMVKKTAVKLLGTGGIVLGVALMVGSAWAGSEFVAPASTSTALLGGAATVTHAATLSASGAHPWVAQIQAPAGRCLRLEVTSETTDLGMQVAAPNAFTAWRNDDKGFGCSLCPLVKIFSTPFTGWYTVSINHFAGAAVNANFVLRFAHYPVGNPNCSIPTAPNLELQNTKGAGNAEVSSQLDDAAPDAQ